MNLLLAPQIPTNTLKIGIEQLYWIMILCMINLSMKCETNFVTRKIVYVSTNWFWNANKFTRISGTFEHHNPLFTFSFVLSFLHFLYKIITRHWCIFELVLSTLQNSDFLQCAETANIFSVSGWMWSGSKHCSDASFCLTVRELIREWEKWTPTSFWTARVSGSHKRL
jgi:hypothetical protein